MFCCACAGSCNHVGAHSYCGFHGGDYKPPSTFTYTTTNWPQPVVLTEEDVDRIADRIIEKLTKKKKLRK